MKHKGKITISRPQYGSGKKKISIQVEDEIAGIRFLEIEIDYDNFAEAITGLAYIDCEFDVFGLCNVGKKIEHKTELIQSDFKEYGKPSEEYINNILKPYEVDGWIASRYLGSKDSRTHNDNGCIFKFNFSRWVDIND